MHLMRKLNVIFLQLTFRAVRDGPPGLLVEPHVDLGEDAAQVAAVHQGVDLPVAAQARDHPRADRNGRGGGLVGAQTEGRVGLQGGQAVAQLVDLA